MSNLRVLQVEGDLGVCVIEPPEGVPPPATKLPVAGDEIIVWLIDFKEVDDHWAKMTVSAVEGNTIKCGYSPEAIQWSVPLRGPAATWKWST
jgi:hypothetical protein